MKFSKIISTYFALFFVFLVVLFFVPILDVVGVNLGISGLVSEERREDLVIQKILNTENTDEALGMIDQSMDDSPGIQELQGDLYYRLSDHKRAVRSWETSKALLSLDRVDTKIQLLADDEKTMTGAGDSTVSPSFSGSGVVSDGVSEIISAFDRIKSDTEGAGNYLYRVLPDERSSVSDIAHFLNTGDETIDW